MKKPKKSKKPAARKPSTKALVMHPGEILAEEFLEPMGITQYRLAKELRIHESRVSDIVLGRRGITADTALRLAKFFGNSPEFWMNLQVHYDLKAAGAEIRRELKEISPAEASRRDEGPDTQYALAP